jgi:protein TonB
MLERRNARPGLRLASVALAGLAHAAVAALLLIPALWLTAPPAMEPVDVSLRYVAPAAPRLGGGGSTGESAPVARASTPKPRATPVFVEPQVIPDATPEPAATAADTALAAADTGTGAIGIPGLPEGPGSPTGDPRSECLENCDENGLPGGSNPVPAHLLAIAPVPIDQPQPRYPATARDAGLTGAVVVEILVGVDGRVTQAKVVRGGPPFERATLEAVRRWRYAPVIHQGRPIVWKSTVTVRFELDGTSTRR